MNGQHLALAARRLSQDAVTGEVVTAMRRHGVRPLLFKGPVLERWLCRDGSERRYGDIDLLVAPERFADAEAVLAELGFAVRLDHAVHVGLPDHEHEWVRPPHSVDLHRGIWGLNGDPDGVWAALNDDVDRLAIGGTTAETPNVAACALLVAVHAVQHGPLPKPREDLRRALAVADASVWRAAARLADRVDARGPFAMGLDLFPEGRELVAELGLPASMSVDDHLRAAGEGKVASGFHRLAQAPTQRARLAMAIDELWPTAAFMRWQHPLARRPRGLAAARAGRLLWLSREGPRAWLAWRRAVAAARQSASAGPPVGRPLTEKLRLGVEILLAYRRARRRMARERDARRLVAFARGDPRRPPATNADTDIREARRLGGAVRRTLWMLPAQRGCLARSLVLVDLLERRGVRTTLVIGARAEPAFAAHAWVELDGEALLSPGGYAASRLAEL